MRSKNGPRRRGFTLVELLVVVLIISILMGVALPLYLSAISDSEKKTCRANMQSIANAVQGAKVRMGAANYTEIIAHNRRAIDVSAANADIGALTDLPAVPVCPAKGTYQIRAVGGGDDTSFLVRCRGTGHGTFQPGVSSN